MSNFFLARDLCFTDDVKILSQIRIILHEILHSRIYSSWA